MGRRFRPINDPRRPYFRLLRRIAIIDSNEGSGDATRSVAAKITTPTARGRLPRIAWLLLSLHSTVALAADFETSARSTETVVRRSRTPRADRAGCSCCRARPAHCSKYFAPRLTLWRQDPPPRSLQSAPSMSRRCSDYLQPATQFGQPLQQRLLR